MPVCSSDGKRLFANKCHARCAGVEDFIDCPGLNMIIPGKTPLPPNKELPLRLQTVGDQDLSSEDENLWIFVAKVAWQLQMYSCAKYSFVCTSKNATKCDVVLSFLYSVTLSSKHNRFMNHEVKKKAVQQLLSLFSHLGLTKNIFNEWMTKEM